MLHIHIEQVDSRAEGFLMGSIVDDLGTYVPALRGEDCVSVIADSDTSIPDLIRQIADRLSEPGWVEKELAYQREQAVRREQGDLPF